MEMGIYSKWNILNYSVQWLHSCKIFLSTIKIKTVEQGIIIFIFIFCQNMAPTLPTMQLDCQELGSGLCDCMLVVAKVALSFQSQAQNRIE